MKKFLSVSTLVFALSAQAAPLPMKNAQSVSWNEFRDACFNPAKYNNQIAQTDITITCTDVVKTWRLDSPGMVQLPTAREIQATVSSNKYNVENCVADVGVNPVGVGCQRFKEVLETYRLEAKVTCDDLKEWNQEVTQFSYCLALVNKEKAMNVDSVFVQDTGVKQDFCTSTSNKPQNTPAVLPKPTDSFSSRR